MDCVNWIGVCTFAADNLSDSMKKKLIFVLSFLACCPVSRSWAQETSLWYDAPAAEWMESMPIGNGRVGAMVFGGVDEETVALNESSMWAGEYDPHQEKPFGRARLDSLRELFFAGKLIEGNGIAGRELVGTPHSIAIFLEEILSPIKSMVSLVGPIKAMPFFTQASAKSGFSERKP